MATERDVTTQLMLALKRRAPGAKIVKHNDRSTSGIPDLSCSWAGFTNWIEVKLVKHGRKLKDVVKFDQTVSCIQFALATGGRCWIVVYEESPARHVTIWDPRQLGAEVWPDRIGVSSESIERKGVLGWDHTTVAYTVVPRP